MLQLVVALALLLSRDTNDRQRSFTNEDLARVAPRSAETGGRSVPASPLREAEPRPGRHDKPGREVYWRTEARRVREKIRAYEDRAVALRQRIEERRRKPGVRPYSDEQIRRWEQQAVELLERGRELEHDLLDRARREGALPGWLR